MENTKSLQSEQRENESKLDLSGFKKQLFEAARAKGAKGFDGQAIVRELMKNALETLLEAEMAVHLDAETTSERNYRNGKTSKTIKSELGEVEIETPRDRNATFEPQIVKKHQRDFTGFTDKIISLYTRGMTTRDIAEHLKEIYGVEVSAQYISQATAAVKDEVENWQKRPLEKMYAILYMDCLRCKVKDNDSAMVQNKAVYIALGVTIEGKYDVLGLWISPNEGSKFWMQVLTDIKARGVEDILISCVDGLTGFPDAIEAVYPQTEVQLCVVHQIRNSTKYLTWKDMKAFCADLKKIYGAPDEATARLGLENLKNVWGSRYGAAIASWENNWDKITAFFRYPVELRSMIYTTNTIESVNRQIRKNTKNRGVFPNDDSLLKLIYLNIQKILEKKTSRRAWSQVRNQLAILFPERVK